MTTKQVRGKDLKEKIIQSREMGEEERATRQGRDQLAAVKPSPASSSSKRKDKSPQP